MFLVAMGATTSVFGQDQNEKDLINSLNITPVEDHDSIYYELFRTILYGTEDLEQAKEYVEKTYTISRKYGHSFRLAKACRALGMLYNRLQSFDSSRYFYRKAISVSETNGHLDLLVYASNDLGLHFEDQDMYDSALKYYSVSLEFATKMGMEEDMSFTLNNIGLIYYHLGDFEDALQSYELSVDLKKRNRVGSLHITLMNIGLLYSDQGRNEEAINLLLEVEKEHADECTKSELDRLYSAIAYAYYNYGSYRPSKLYFEKAYGYAKESNDLSSLSFILYHFGLLQIKERDYVHGEKYFLEALTIANEVNSKRLKRDIFLSLRDLYIHLRDLDKVVEYQNRFIAIKDSIFNGRVAGNLSQIQLTAQKKELDSIIEEKENKVRAARTNTILIGIVAFLLIAISVLLFIGFRTRGRINRILNARVKDRTKELVTQNRELSSNAMEQQSLNDQMASQINALRATLSGLMILAKNDFAKHEEVMSQLEKIELEVNGLSKPVGRSESA